MNPEMKSNPEFEELYRNTRHMLDGIHRYNPENVSTFTKYVDLQARLPEAYDLEANLTLLKLYQFSPSIYCSKTAQKILMKALANLPHSDFILAKALLSQNDLQEEEIVVIQELSELLETCKFKEFWKKIRSSDFPQSIMIAGFDDSIRKFVCHIVGITFQKISVTTLAELLGLKDEAAVNVWIQKCKWSSCDTTGYVMVSNQEEMIKTKKITEKIDMNSVAGIMAASF